MLPYYIVEARICHMPEYCHSSYSKSAFCPHRSSKTPMPLVNCIANDGLVNAMPNTQQMLLQFINVVHPRLIDLLLDDTPSSGA